MYPKFKATDDTGAPLVGGKLYTYTAGGPTTPKLTYDAAISGSANQNPVILDSDGEADVYGSGLYYMVLTDANDVQLWVEDNVTGASSPIGDESTVGLPAHRRQKRCILMVPRLLRLSAFSRLKRRWLMQTAWPSQIRQHRTSIKRSLTPIL